MKTKAEIKAQEKYEQGLHEKAELGDALRILLKKNTLENITIKEIFEKAKVTRSCFYKYFPTKEDLAEWEYIHLLALEAKHIVASESWSEALYKKFQLYEKHYQFFRHLYGSKNIDQIRRHNVRFTRGAYTKMLKKGGADLSNPHILFALEMAVVGGEEMTMRWIVSGMKAPKEVLLVLFQESIPKCICQYFQ
ncbi:MAG: TetR/AcrR family transcriptional regulator [Acidaminococcaceae bacterium]|jgi:AcrR family transcriptional regulator|nr:TetR/AcrR family transcriptional regulator [Acidaminococcaceae bacterium]